MNFEVSSRPKNARILHDNCPKIFFPNFGGARATRLLPQSPMVADNVLRDVAL